MFSQSLSKIQKNKSVQSGLQNEQGNITRVSVSQLQTASNRNELLNKTERYFSIDYPIAYEQQNIIKSYRQELRDFINNNIEKILNGEKIEFGP
jgi:hypothetical protein